ncbi:NAD(P)H-dependent oxidoreductase [Streptomyces sp. A5-4]
MLISSPECDASVPGAVKNAVDRVSRFLSQPFRTRSH